MKEKQEERKAMLNLLDELDEPLLQRGLGVVEVFNLGSHFDLLSLSVRLYLLHLLLQLVSLRLR